MLVCYFRAPPANLLVPQRLLGQSSAYQAETPELNRHRRVRQVPIGHLVHAIDEISSLLKFDREKESCRDVNAFHFNAGRVTATRGNLVGPEISAALVGLTVEKVEILLADEKSWSSIGLKTELMPEP